MIYLKRFLKERKGKVAVTLILLLGQVVGTLFIPFLIAGMVNNGILRGDLAEILRSGGYMLAITFATTVVAVLGSYYSADLAALFGHDMREKLFRQSQELSIRQFDEIGVSSLVTRATTDIAILQQTLGMVLQLIVPAPIVVIAAIVMTAGTSLPLASLLACCVVLFIGFASFVLKKSKHLSQQVQFRLDRINQVVRESLTGVRVIRAFGNERYEESRSGRAFEQCADNMIKLNKLFAVLNPAVWLLMGLLMAAIIWLGGRFSLQGSMAIGEITAVTEYAIIALSYLILAAFVSATLPKARSCLDRLEEVLTLSPELQDLGGSAGNSQPNGPVVAFENVTFAYHGAEQPVIRDLSFRCYAGETIAIIGGTGSGKSTIANLLLRLHDPSDGQILVNGVEIRQLPQQVLRESVGYVPQKALLFSGTIADNLRMGHSGATAEEMKAALRIAQADAFVSQLPLGLETPVAQGGTNFSGGQKQRLSIARALVKKAPIYLFDDSFSALDVKTDAALRRAIKEQVTGAVKIIIAQRISTIMDADQILVLDEGRLVGIGKHETLIKSCSVYQAIESSQLNGKGAAKHGAEA